MTNKLTFLGKDFKTIVAGVTRFPSLGNFAGSEVVSLSGEKGKCIMSARGLVQTRCLCTVEGDCSVVGVDERLLSNFANLTPDAAKVTFTIAGQEAFLRSGRRELAIALQAGAHLPFPKAASMTLQISKDTAQRIAYLSQIAYADQSRAELACVMMTKDNLAIACNQKLIAVLKSGEGVTAHTAVPINIAKCLAAGDRLHIDKTTTILVNGGNRYAIASPVKAQSDFPLVKVIEYAKSKKDSIASCDGTRLANVVAECASSLAQTSKTEVVAVVTVSAADKKITVSVANTSAKFKSSLPTISANADAEFQVPLEQLVQYMPFVSSKATLMRTLQNALFIDAGSGWALYPAWSQPQKKKSK